jgi:rubrerythrin
MIAQRTKTNNVVVTGDDATVQAAVKLLTQKQKIATYRWVCEVCGMIHTGAVPTSCDSCGANASSIVHLADFRTEMNRRC